MHQMKRLFFLIPFLLVFASCRERPAVGRDTIPYVKQLAVDTAGVFSLVRSYRTAGTEGSIAILGEPDPSYLLAQEFLAADRYDNIDGKTAPDRLPDFAGETFDVVLDLYNDPYIRMAAASPDSLREVAVRNAVMAVDTVAFSDASDRGSRLRKTKAKVFVLASSLQTEWGRFDIDTLFRMAGRDALILSPVEAMLSVARDAGCNRVAVWAPEEAKAAYDSVAKESFPGMEVTVISTTGNGILRPAFRDMLRLFRAVRPNASLDAVLLDSFKADLDDLYAEQEHIHRQITEEDMAFDRILAPGFRFIEPKSSLTTACYRFLREHNLFTHNIARPSAHFYQTEEGPYGEYVLVELGSDYLSSLTAPSPHVPDHD